MVPTDWTGVTGASTRQHPAPYPLELAERLVRMYSFVGDTVLDPFLGTGTTSVVAAYWGRNSIGIEVDEHYVLNGVRLPTDAGPPIRRRGHCHRRDSRRKRKKIAPDQLCRCRP